MEAIVGVWLSSLLGAGAFSTMGYILGQRGVVISFLRLPPPDPVPPVIAAAPPKPEAPPRTGRTARPPIDLTDPAEELTGATKRNAHLGEIAAAELEHARAAAQVASLIDEEDDDKSTLARRSSKVASVHTKTEPPKDGALHAARAEAESARRELQAVLAELEGLKGELDVALKHVQEANKTARAADAARGEIDRQLEVIRAELRREVVARANAEQNALELGDRLARASEEAGALRHKLSGSERQIKQLSGRPQAPERRARELEEIDSLRSKLREVSLKLERSSGAPPPPSSRSQVAISGIPPQPKTPVPTSSGPSSKPSDDAAKLREENIRLTKENRSLRARALGAPNDTKPSRSVSDIDIEGYRSLIERIGAIGGIRAAVLADEVGSVLVGRGDLADGLAAFGAYIRDASSRTERILPMELLEEIDIRDRAGAVLSTRIVTAGPGALSLVFLGPMGDAVKAAKRAIEEHPRIV